MKFKSGLVTQASGSVGGMTASRNRGGLYLRARAMPVNPATAAQTDVRAIFSAAATRWRDVLTATQRNAWDQYAELTPLPDALGEPRNVGGLGMYVRGMVPRRQASLEYVDAGPATTGVPTFTPVVAGSLDPTAGLGITIVNTDGWASQPTGALLVYMSRGVSEARNFFKGPFQFVGRVLGATPTPPANSQVFTVSVLPFTVTPGLKYFIRTRVVDSLGRTSFDAVTSVEATSGG